MHNSLSINARFLTKPTVGTSRFASEITRRLVVNNTVRLLAPRFDDHANEFSEHTTQVGKLSGHAWEQLSLPRHLGKTEVLWSPSTTGPLRAQHHVVTIHDLFAIENPEWVTRQFHLYYSWLLPRLARRVKLITTVSDWSRGRIIEVLKVDPDRVILTPNGVDSMFRPMESEKAEPILQALGIDRPFVLAVGSLEPRKNLPRLASAWESVSRAHPDHVLVLAGGSGATQVFRGSGIDPTDPGAGIVLTGRVSDEQLRALYSTCDAYCCPSIAEGFGIPPIEAAACGASVAVSNNSGLYEFCGQFAVMIDPLSVSSIADGISEAIKGHGRHDNPSQLHTKLSWDRSADSLMAGIGTLGSPGG